MCWSLYQIVQDKGEAGGEEQAVYLNWCHIKNYFLNVYILLFHVYHRIDTSLFHTGRFWLTELLQKPEHILVMNLKIQVNPVLEYWLQNCLPQTSLASRYIGDHKPNQCDNLRWECVANQVSLRDPNWRQLLSLDRSTLDQLLDCWHSRQSK